MENIFYAIVIILSAAASIWAISMAFHLSPTFQEWRGSRKIEAIAKKHESRNNS